MYAGTFLKVKIIDVLGCYLGYAAASIWSITVCIGGKRKAAAVPTQQQLQRTHQCTDNTVIIPVKYESKRGREDVSRSEKYAQLHLSWDSKKCNTEFSIIHWLLWAQHRQVLSVLPSAKNSWTLPEGQNWSSSVNEELSLVPLSAEAVPGGWRSSNFSNRLYGLLEREEYRAWKRAKPQFIALQVAEYAPTISWLKRLIKWYWLQGPH